MLLRESVRRRLDAGVESGRRPARAREEQVSSAHQGGAQRAGRTREEAEEGLDRDLLALVVDLDAVAVQVDLAVGVRVDGAGERVARVARDVVGEHEDDLRVGDAEALDGAVPAGCTRSQGCRSTARLEGRA